MEKLKQWTVGAALILVALIIIASCGGKDEGTGKGDSRK